MLYISKSEIYQYLSGNKYYVFNTNGDRVAYTYEEFKKLFLVVNKYVCLGKSPSTQAEKLEDNTYEIDGTYTLTREQLEFIFKKVALKNEPDLYVLYVEDNTPWRYDPEVGDWTSEFDSVSRGNLLEVYGPMYGEKQG